MTVLVIPQDIVGGAVLPALEHSSVTWGKTVSGTSTFEVTVDALSAGAANLEKLRRFVYIRNGQRIIYDGFCWSTNVDPVGQTKKAAGADLWSYIGARLLSSAMGPYVATEQFAVVADLLAEMDTEGGDLGITLRRNPTNSGTARTKTYETWELKSFAEAILDFGEAENGFEFITSAAYEAGAFVRYLDIWSPLLGVVTPMVWEHGVHINCTNITDDGNRAANRVHAIGAGTGAGKVVETAEDVLGPRPRLDGTITRTDVADTTFLTALANSELARLRDGVKTFAVDMLSNGYDGALDTLGGWNPGDTIYLKIDAPGVTERLPARIMAYTATDDADKGLSGTATLVAVDPTVGAIPGRPLLDPQRQLDADHREQLRILNRIARQ